jgi:hypothetical protein
VRGSAEERQARRPSAPRAAFPRGRVSVVLGRRLAHGPCGGARGDRSGDLTALRDPGVRLGAPELRRVRRVVSLAFSCRRRVLTRVYVGPACPRMRAAGAGWRSSWRSSHDPASFGCSTFLAFIPPDRRLGPNCPWATSMQRCTLTLPSQGLPGLNLVGGVTDLAGQNFGARGGALRSWCLKANCPHACNPICSCNQSGAPI